MILSAPKIRHSASRLALSILLPTLSLAPANLRAQLTEIYDKNVKTVELKVNEDVSGKLPVIKLGANDELHISFDELSHDYHRYTYKIEHLDADFEPTSSLFESDYVRMSGDEGLIEDYTQSKNTTTLYTHYAFSLPNDYMKPLLSGNYALTVYNADEDEPVPLFKTFFYVTEETASLSMTGKTDTDIDKNARHQQLEVFASWEDLPLRDTDQEIKLVVLQNNRWDNAAIGPSPTGIKVNSLSWQYCRDLIFEAGNEYRKFEMSSSRFPGLHIDKVRYYAPYVHVAIRTDEQRLNYLYDEDQNGRFVPISDVDDADADTEADYMWMHFTLDREELIDGGQIYLNGAWSYDRLDPEYLMTYNPETAAYEGSILLKQGYYSYQYLTKSKSGKISPEPVEGNYFQTENEYTLLLYFRQTGARYDRLVGCRTFSYRPQ